MMQVEVKSGTMTKDEIQYYILLVKKRWGTRLPADLRLILEKTDAEVQITFDPPIDRQVYRSTDYLVNDVQKLNRGKFAARIFHQITKRDSESFSLPLSF